jgi:ABC-2 type transport system ATP-binding protein
MIEVERLTKDYGTVVAVRDVSFSVGKGEVVGFLGPNGAGKSTTLRILSGFLGATAGRVQVSGFDIATESLAARRALGYMPEAAPLYPELRVREYLDFRAALKQVPSRERKKAVERALELGKIADVAETVIGHLSKGYRQRVALADALVSKPSLLILDEPTAGLDPNQILEVRRLLRELGESHTILLSTHILSEVEAVCDRALVIARGRLVAEGTLTQLLSMQKSRDFAITARASAAVIENALAKVEHAQLLTSESLAGGFQRVIVHAAGDDPDSIVEHVVAALVAEGAGVRGVSPLRATLEEVFAELTLRADTPKTERTTRAGAEA